MYLEKFILRNIGSFYEEDYLILDKDLTIITGENDTGKSTILKSLESFLTEKPLNSIYHNHHRMLKDNTTYISDDNSYVELHFRSTKSEEFFFGEKIKKC